MSTAESPSSLSFSMSELALNDQPEKEPKEEKSQKPKVNESSDEKKSEQKVSSGETLELIRNMEICEHFIKDINSFGISVLDGFLGSERGNLVFDEVLKLHESGLFREGQLVRNNTQNNNIRGDQIVWLQGNEEKYPNIRRLVNEIDGVVLRANRFPNNGKLGKYKIDGRTKAMVACYPGNGAHYVKHVDNPNGDGRVITAIYYLNKNWQRQEHGGMLRIFPTNERNIAADIDPVFDRMLFFWSDRRNPHEVQPSFRTRYAITIWYFDATERDEAVKRQLNRDRVEEQKKTDT